MRNVKPLMILILLGAGLSWLPGRALALSDAADGSAGDGNATGNGGDSYSLQFINTAYELLGALRRAYPASVPQIDLDAFANAIETTRVESTDQELGPILGIGNIQKDAANFPDQKRILIRRQSWQEMPGAQKIQLVFHEYLGILRLETMDYPISSKLKMSFQKRFSSVELRPYFWDTSSFPTENLNLCAAEAERIRTRVDLMTSRTGLVDSDLVEVKAVVKNNFGKSQVVWPTQGGVLRESLYLSGPRTIPPSRLMPLDRAPKRSSLCKITVYLANEIYRIETRTTPKIRGREEACTPEFQKSDKDPAVLWQKMGVFRASFLTGPSHCWIDQVLVSRF